METKTLLEGGEGEGRKIEQECTQETRNDPHSSDKCVTTGITIRNSICRPFAVSVIRKWNGEGA